VIKEIVSFRIAEIIFSSKVAYNSVNRHKKTTMK